MLPAADGGILTPPLASPDPVPGAGEFGRVFGGAAAFELLFASGGGCPPPAVVGFCDVSGEVEVGLLLLPTVVGGALSGGEGG